MNRFPVFCGSLVGGYYLCASAFQVVIVVISRVVGRRDLHKQVIRWQRIARPLAAFCSAWINLGLFNTKDHSSRNGDHHHKNLFDRSRREKSSTKALKIYGRSVDLTLFTAARAVDCIIQAVQVNRNPPTRLCQTMPLTSTRRLNSVVDPVIFASSAGIIMWAWFYYPMSLPRSYKKWIGQAAQVDWRLVQILRDAREGNFIYGCDCGQSRILKGMCEDYKWPAEWADSSKTIPVPCQMVHMGAGPSCHWHAVVRFARTFKFAMKMYLPLQLLLKCRRPSKKALRKILEESLRSSIFLSTFVASFYYGVCLSRTLIGPSISRSLGLSPMFWDSGACIATGSVLCGWSVLIEDEKRRQEMAMFVLPRALATFFPRHYGTKVRQAY